MEGVYAGGRGGSWERKFQAWGKAFRGEGTVGHRSGGSLAKDKIKGTNSSLLIAEFGFYLVGI